MTARPEPSSSVDAEITAHLERIYAALPPERRRRIAAKRLAAGQFGRKIRAEAALRGASNVPAPASGAGLTLETVDAMTGRQFEEFLAWLFADRGVEVSLTPATADRGADLLIARDDGRHLIQAKRHALSSRVSGDAVREAMAARVHYEIPSASVVTNAYFTTQAIETARENGIELIDREGLSKLLARAKERRTLSAKDDPRRRAIRSAVAPIVEEIRGGVRRLPTSPHSSTRTDQPWLATSLNDTFAEAGMVARRAREFVASIDALLEAFTPNRAEQAYDLAIPDERLKTVLAHARNATNNLVEAHTKLGSRWVPTRRPRPGSR